MAPKNPQLVVHLNNPQPKKRVVRYNAATEEDESVLQSAYVGREGLATLGDPSSIRITIEAAG